MQNWTLRWVLVSPPPDTWGQVCPEPQARQLGRSSPPAGDGEAGFQESGGRAGSPLLAQDSLPFHPLQKIMHTRKRHQDMFQDLNRKLQHAEKDKEMLGPESKV